MARSFARLRATVVPPELEEAFTEAARRERHSLLDLPPEAFPAFLNARQFLRMLDGGRAGYCCSMTQWHMLPGRYGDPLRSDGRLQAAGDAFLSMPRHPLPAN